MKRLSAIMITAFVCISLPTFLHAGTIALSGTPDGTDCAVIDSNPGIVEVHIVLTDITGVSAVQFWAPKPDCWDGAVWMGDEFAFPLFIGDTQNNDIGVSVAFSACLDAPVYVGSMTFNTSGAGTLCCPYPVLKANRDNYPEIDGPIIVVCTDPPRVAGVTASAIVNPTPECACQSPTPVQETTWGAVKALFR